MSLAITVIPLHVGYRSRLKALVEPTITWRKSHYLSLVNSPCGTELKTVWASRFRITKMDYRCRKNAREPRLTYKVADGGALLDSVGTQTAIIILQGSRAEPKGCARRGML